MVAKGGNTIGHELGAKEGHGMAIVAELALGGGLSEPLPNVGALIFCSSGYGTTRNRRPRRRLMLLVIR